MEKQNTKSRIKTFVFHTSLTDEKVIVNNKLKGNYRVAEYHGYPIFDVEKMDKVMNEFISNNVSELIDIKYTSSCFGNNPPRYFTLATIIYMP